MIVLAVYAVIFLLIFNYVDRVLVYFGFVKALNWSERSKFLDATFSYGLLVGLLVVAVVI